MIQFIVNNDAVTPFGDGNLPKLISVSRIGEFYIKHPRILHAHDDIIEILFIASGSGVYVIGERHYTVSEGDIIICNRNVLHDEIPESNIKMEAYCCSVTNVNLPGLDINCLIPEGIQPVFSSGQTRSKIKSILDILFSVLVSKSPGQETTANYLMLSLLSMIMPILDENQKKEIEEMDAQHELCKKAKLFINENYMEDITVDDIAKVLCISSSHLSHIFKDIAGYSVKNYVLRRRIGEAQTLLINTGDSITSIASAVGYGNPNYFNVIFSKTVGMAPSKYRKLYSSLSHK